MYDHVARSVAAAAAIGQWIAVNGSAVSGSGHVNAGGICNFVIPSPMNLGNSSEDRRVCRWDFAKDVVNMLVKQGAAELFREVVGHVETSINAF
jgi:hypothetical protein